MDIVKENEAQIKHENNQSCKIVKGFGWFSYIKCHKKFKKDATTKLALNQKAEKKTKNIISENHLIKKNSILEKKLFVCEICEYSTFRNSNFITHKKIHSGEKSLSRNLCNYIYRQNIDLAIHKRMLQGENSSRFYSKSVGSFNRVHKSQQHFNGEMCLYCNRIFSLSLINKHKIIHSEKIFSCDICDKSYFYLSSLNCHKNIHKDEKKDNCHLAKQFNCDLCNRRFKQLANLKNHVRVRLSQKPLICDICNRIFCQYSKLNRHKRKIHGFEKL